MPNVLEVQIIGDVSALEKSLNEAKKLQAEYTASIEKTSAELKENIIVTNGYKKAIDDLNSAYKNGSVSSKDYSKQLANLKRDEKEAGIATADLRKQLALLKREQKDLGGGFGELSKKTADGSNALMQFSRIAQDAPFGIVGIGNNITATVEAFGHLQKSTGSTSAALKAMASSILGSGGILLAVSLVTTALTYMSQKGLSIGDVFDMLTGKFDKNAKALSELNQEVAKTAGEEIATVKGLVSTAQDATLSTEKRLLAVNKLQSEFPAYFGNLTKEKILNGDVSTAVDDVSKALIARARASAIAGKLGENAAARLALEEKREAAILDIQKAQKSAREDNGTFSKSFNALDLDVALKAYRGIVAEIKELDASSKKYSERENQATKDSILLLKEKDKVVKETNANTNEAIIPFKTELKPELDVEKTTEALLEVKNEYGKLQEKVIKFEEIQPPKITITSQVTDEFIKNLEKLDELSAKYEKITGQKLVLPAVITSEYVNSLDRALAASQLFATGSSSAISSLAGELASSLETGNAALDAFVGSVIQGFAEVVAAQITGLIAQQAVATASLATNAAVSTGNAVTAATSTAAATGPAAAFVLPALVGAAIGFIAAAFSGIKFAHGGIVPGGSFTGDKIPAMLNSGEAVMNQQQQANTLMAIANGNSNSLQGNIKSSNFNLQTKLRGSDIVLALKREEKSR